MPHSLPGFNILKDSWAEIYGSTHLTEGKYVRLFEEAVSAVYGLHAVAFNSAGTGLYSMIRCLSGREFRAAVPNNTFYATGAMAKEAGLTVRLVDCRVSDFAMSATSLADYAGCDLVILTHVGGSLADDYRAIATWCREHNAILLEDAAHAFGTMHEGLFAGKYGHAAVFSLYPTKAIPAGEGGVVITQDADYAERLREFRNYGKYVENGVIQYRGSGFNFRMDEWTAAVAYHQVHRLKEINEQREEAAHRLSEIMPTMVRKPSGASNYYKYPVMREFAEREGFTRLTGQIYAESDQLHRAMGVIVDRHDISNSLWVAKNHVCLPVDYALYRDKTKDQIVDYLRGK